jgi:alkanesulfonate monooxygenase SsuD/methylene tetrahydromethanopterin reductase-like flavin-dependent oxidoreductase (luciferase family)
MQLRIANMNNKKTPSLGILFRREHAPENLAGFAKKAEQAGFAEIWVTEDCFYAGGIASAAVALASTSTISVGVGILPAVVRNPVFTAMEIATLASCYPGRFLPGIGHGVERWMRQIGEFPASQLTALEEVTVAVRELLAGKQVEYTGKQVQISQAELIHPPLQIPPVYLGVRGAKSLALAGRIADGTILAEYSSPAYVAWARQQIEMGKGQEDERHHHLTVFVLACAATADKARAQLKPLVAAAILSETKDIYFAPLGILPQVKKLRQGKDVASLIPLIPDAWIDELAIFSTAHDWNQSIERYVKAGADTIVLVPLPNTGVEELDSIMDRLFQ